MRSRLAVAGRQSVFGIDHILRALYGVKPFTDEPGCMLRLAADQSRRAITLSDGIRIQKGASLIGLHFWNERLEDSRPRSASLNFSKTHLHNFRLSLRVLAREFDRLSPELARAPALRGEMGFFTDERRARRLGNHLGFDVVVLEKPRARFWKRVFWDNLYAYWLMWAYSPGSLEGKSLTELIRIEAWMSRERLMKLYG